MRETDLHKQAWDFSRAMHAFEYHVERVEGYPPDVQVAYENSRRQCLESKWVLPDAATSYYFGLVEAYLIQDGFLRYWTGMYPDDENAPGLHLAIVNMYVVAKVAFDYIRADMEGEEQKPDWVPDDLGQ